MIYTPAGEIVWFAVCVFFIGFAAGMLFEWKDAKRGRRTLKPHMDDRW